MLESLDCALVAHHCHGHSCEFADACSLVNRSDDSEHKYKALSEWSTDFERRTGQKPRLWLDKACSALRISKALILM